MRRHWKASSSRCNSVSRPGITILGVFALLASTASCQRSPETTQATYFVLGTEVTIAMGGLTEAHAHATLANVQQTLQNIHTQWHAWEPGMLTALNGAFQEDQCLAISQPLREVLEQAQNAEKRSGGLFNAATGGLIKAWGFHTSEYPLTSAPPAAADLQILIQQRPSMMDVDLGSDCVSSNNPAVKIDLGGIGKGAAVDQVTSLMKRQGVAYGLVNAGGDLRGFGAKPQPWRIAIRNPSQTSPLALLELRGDESVFTSGGYARYGQHEGERYAHILDPRTGKPAMDVLSATAIASTGAVADAGATALIVAGPDNAMVIARSMGLTHLLIIEPDGCVSMDAELASRLHYPAKSPDCLNILQELHH